MTACDLAEFSSSLIYSLFFEEGLRSFSLSFFLLLFVITGKMQQSSEQKKYSLYSFSHRRDDHLFRKEAQMSGNFRKSVLVPIVGILGSDSGRAVGQGAAVGVLLRCHPVHHPVGRGGSHARKWHGPRRKLIGASGSRRPAQLGGGAMRRLGRQHGGGGL